MKPKTSQPVFQLTQPSLLSKFNGWTKLYLEQKVNKTSLTVLFLQSQAGQTRMSIFFIPYICNCQILVFHEAHNSSLRSVSIPELIQLGGEHLETAEQDRTTIIYNQTEENRCNLINQCSRSQVKSIITVKIICNAYVASYSDSLRFSMYCTTSEGQLLSTLQQVVGWIF